MGDANGPYAPSGTGLDLEPVSPHVEVATTPTMTAAADVDAEIRGDEVATSVSTDEQQDENEDRRRIGGVHE